MTSEQRAKAISFIAEMAEDLKEVVAEVEGRAPSTRGNYAKYATIIKNLTKEEEMGMVYAIATSLIQAGANPRGVRDAVTLIEENLI